MIYWTTYNFAGFLLYKFKYIPMNSVLKTSFICTSLIGGYMVYIYPRKMIARFHEYKYTIPYPILIIGDFITHKKDKEYKNQIKISEKKSIHYPLRKPIYSLIIYGSEYKKDFTGGIIEFSDGLKIKPEKNKCILFDSREAHCVHKIKSGIRQCILIKFYEK